MTDPEIWLPGIYIARVVATMSNDEKKEISPEVDGSPSRSEVPLVSKDAEMLNSLAENVMTFGEKAGTGESEPQWPPNSLQGVALHMLQGVAIGLQGKESFLPVGNRFGNHADTEIRNSGVKGIKEKLTKEKGIK
jgi:hypothetical protein